MQITGFDHYFHDQEMAIQPTAFATMFDTYPLLNGRGYPDTIKTTPVRNSLDKDSQCVSSLDHRQDKAREYCSAFPTSPRPSSTP